MRIFLLFCISRKQENEAHFSFLGFCFHLGVGDFLAAVMVLSVVCFVGVGLYFLFFSIHSSSPLGQLIKFAVESKSN